MALPSPSVAEDMTADYATTELALGVNAVSLLRGPAAPRDRQRHHLRDAEDERGNVQVLVWPTLGERQRKELIGSRMLIVEGRWDYAEGVGNLIAERLRDMSEWLGQLDTRSRDFH